MGTAMMETAITAKPTPTGTLAPAAPPGASRRAAWLCLSAPACSAILLWACFHPVAWGAYLGWIALTPFLVLIRAQSRPRFVYLCAFLCGIVFYVPVLSWMSVADKSMVAAWLALSVYCSLFFPAALCCMRVLDRLKLPLVLTAPMVWVAFEYVRCWALTGFPWYLMAHTQHDVLPMIQITDLGGVFLVSFVVVAVNALVFDIAYQVPEVRGWFGQAELEPYRYYASLEILNRGSLGECLMRRNLILEGTVVAAALLGTFVYGEYRMGQAKFQPGPTVALLQSSIDQRLRENQDQRSRDAVTKHFSPLVMIALNNPRPDLVIWPETSYPMAWCETSRDLPLEDEPPDWREEVLSTKAALKELAATTKVPHLLGMNAFQYYAPGKRPRAYNSAILLNPALDDKGKPTGKFDGKFDKVHRVPFGEYILMGDWFPFLAYLTPYEGDFGIQAGKKLTRFQSGRHHFGVLICYEDTDPFMARRYLEDSDDGPPVDFLVNMSNDGWFNGSSEHEEHLAVCRFRAIECRRSMVRAVNMGVSAVIDGNGRIMKANHIADSDPALWTVNMAALGANDLPTSQWHLFKKKAGVLKAIVPIDQRYSFYAATGDWLPIGSWVVLAAGLAWPFMRRKFATLARSAT